MQKHRLLPITIILFATAMISCGEMYSDLVKGVSITPDKYVNDGYIGGSPLGPPLVYTNSSLYMGGQGWDAGPTYPSYYEGVGYITDYTPGTYLNSAPPFSCWSGAFGIATDGTYLYIYDRDNRRLRTIDPVTRQSATVAGNGTDGDTDGIGTAATLHNILFLTYGGDGYVYMTDNASHTIRRYNTTTREVTTIAGQPGVSGTADGTSTDARFNGPSGITADGKGNLYIADTGNNTIRKMNLVTGQVTTIAGLAGASGTVDGTGSIARFSNLMGMTTDGTYLYILQGWGTNYIRRFTISTNDVITFAGNAGITTVDGTGTGASFDNLYNIACDGSNLYTVDWGGNLRKIVITTRQVSTLPGSVANNTGICYDGARLYITAPNYNMIAALW
jgi:hypothetical protein